MANFLAQRAPRDGSAIAILHQTMAEEQALGAENVQFDVSQFQWIGRITSNVEIAYTWHSSAAKTMEDVKRRETVMSAAGPPGFVFPHLLNKTIGTQFKIIRGYQGTKEANLAMERGETEGSTSSINTIVTTTDWMDSGKLNILVQYAPSRHPKLPDVPTVIELVSAPEDKTLFTFLTQGSAIGRSFAAPPGTPRQHVEALRAAFDQTMKDPLFLAEIEKTKAEFEPATGAQLQQMFGQRAGLSSANKERAQAARKEN
jgi:tripartite-type tricarboxylate transporter receptor subunit TctC